VYVVVVNDESCVNVLLLLLQYNLYPVAPVTALNLTVIDVDDAAVAVNPVGVDGASVLVAALVAVDFSDVPPALTDATA